MIRRSLLAALALMLLIPLDVWAKGAPREVTIAGPGLVRPLVVRGAAASPLGLGSFENLVVGPIPAPRRRSGGYELDRDHWDHAVYYPRCGRGRGYVHYLGLYNGWSEYDGKWFYATAGGEQDLLRILAAHHSTPLGCAH